MNRFSSRISNIFPALLIMVAGAAAVVLGDAAPTSSGLVDASYRFLGCATVAWGLRRAPSWLLLLCAGLVTLFVGSVVAFVCAVSAVAVAASLVFGGSPNGDSGQVRDAEAIQPVGTLPRSDDGVEDRGMSGAWPSFVLALALLSLSDRLFYLSSFWVASTVILIAGFYVLRDCSPKVRLIGVRLVGVTGILLVGLGLLYGWQAQHRAADLGALQSTVSSGDIADLPATKETLFKVRDSLDRIWFRPLEAVPGVAQNVGSARELAVYGSDVVTAGEQLIDGRSSQVATGSSSLPEAELVELCGKLSDLDASLERSTQKPLLVPKIRRAVNLLDTELDEFGEVGQFCPIADQLEELLGFEEKRTYLTLFMTTAEVRGIGGLVSNWALIEVDRGQVVVRDSGRSVPMNEKLASVDSELLLPDDSARLWEIYELHKYFQDIGVSPSGEVVASAASQLFGQVYPDVETDGVAILGPQAMAGLVSLVGDFQVGEETIKASETVDFLTREQYELDVTYGERVEMLDAILEKMASAERPSAPEDLVESLRFMVNAVNGGELLLVPNDEVDSADLKRSPLAGFLPSPEEYPLVGVVEQNFGLDKLDPYLERTATLHWENAQDSSPTLTLHYTNNASTDLPEYVLGFGDTEPAVNRLRVGSYAPVHADSVTVVSGSDESSAEILFGSEKGNQVSMAVVDIPPGASVSVQFEFSNWSPPSDRMWVLKPPSINDRALSVVIGGQQWTTSQTARLSTLEVN